MWKIKAQGHGYLLFFAFLVALFMLAPMVSAQTDGQVEGVVTEQDDEALPGVKVVATSPSLMGERAVITDKEGVYRLPALPTGIYALYYELQGYQPTRISEVMVFLGKVTRLDAKLGEGEPIETVNVTAEYPLIDRISADTSLNLVRSSLESIPTPTRDIRDLTRYVPSITGVDLDNVDGTRDGYPSIRGEGEYGDNYMIDGLSVRDPAIKTIASQLNYDAIDEVQIVTDGFSPEYGQALGGIVNVVTKSGSNEFGGEVAWIYEDDSLAASSQPVLYAQPEAWETSQPYLNVGGPIIRDKLWYFGSFNRSENTEEYAPAHIFGFGELDPGIVDTETDLYFGKLTWSMAYKHILSGNYSYRDQETTGLGSANSTTEARYGKDVVDRRIRVSYKALFSENSVMEVKYGTVDQEIDMVPVSGRDAAQYGLAHVGILTNNAWRLSSYERNRDDWALIYTQFLNPGGNLGSHEIRVGYEGHEGEQVSLDEFTGTGEDVFDDAFDDGARYWISSYGGVLYPAALYEYKSSGALLNGSDEYGFFLQDRWEIGNVNVMVGARWDMQDVYNNDGDLIYEAQSSDATAPRVSVTWDVGGKGKNVFKAGWGRFYDVTSTRFGEYANTRSGHSLGYYWWNGNIDEDFRDHIDDGSVYDIHNPANWNLVHQESALLNPLDYSFVEKPNHVERQLVEYNRQIGQNYAFKARYVNGKARDLLEDVALTAYDWRLINWDRKQRDYQALELEFNGNPTPNIFFNASWVHSAAKGTNPGQFERSSFFGATGSGNYIGAYGDRPPSDPGFWISYYGPPGVPGYWLGNPRRDYNNDDTVDARDRDTYWQFMFAGLGGLDGDDGWYGYLPYSIDDLIKLHGRFQFPKLRGLYVDAFLTWASGYHSQRKGLQPLYGDYLTFSSNPEYFSYSGACTSFANCETVWFSRSVHGQSFNAGDGETRGTREGSSYWTLDVTVGKNWNVGRDMTFGLQLDAFNLLNEDEVLLRMQRAVSTFGEPLVRLRARQFRIMARVGF